jgi:hypothetical protein
MPDIASVARHYTQGNLLDAIRAGVEHLGKSPDTVTVEDLAPVDEFHIGGRVATESLFENVYYRHGLSPEERVSILGKHLGVTAFFLDYVDSTETQFIFEQSGPIPARESFEPAPFKREELDDGRMRYVVASMPLIRLVRYAWWRSTDNRPGVYTWPASPGTSGVWKQLVDADFTTDGTWGQNASYLRERFGVIYETREKLLRTRFIELSQ